MLHIEIPHYLRHCLSGLLLFLAFGLTIPAAEIQQLHENWFFRQAGETKWTPAQVPGGVHTDLLRAGKIEDPFYRNNEDSLQWIGEKDWEYESRFIPSESIMRQNRIELSFEGLDTYADVYLNDSLILQANNMFRAWRVEVKPLLKDGMNRLRIYFHAPEKAVAADWGALGYELPGGIRTLSRKAAFHYGWDWGPRFLTAGVWRSVSLEGWSGVRIRDLHIQQVLLDESQAKLLLVASVEADRPTQLGMVVAGEVLPNRKGFFLREGMNLLQQNIEIQGKPRLWWSRGLGEAYRYELTVRLGMGDQFMDSMSQKIGLRTIRLVREKDALKAPGQDTVAANNESFYFELNGVPVFAKGANYIPQDIFQERVSREKYEALIKNVTAANMNMLRVWGGGIYENDIFYELCDEKGILVWQDFMFACAMYPSDTSFLRNVEAEARHNIRRLRHHPCIALWCGNNENIEGWRRWGWQNAFDERQKAYIWAGYDRLFHHILPTAVQELQADVAYWPSSPSFGRGNPRHQFEGDSHYWGVWHDAEPFEILNEKVPRFMSEFGFQSFPEPQTVASYALPEDMALTSEVMLAHQKHPRGNQLIATYMERDFDMPKNFHDFLYLSQLLQAEGMRIGLEAHRRSQPFCMGTLYWQLNDCWPVASWSGLDNQGNWKAMHYRVRDVFAPISIFPWVKDDKLQVWIASDQGENVPLVDLQLEVWDTKGKLKKVFRMPVGSGQLAVGSRQLADFALEELLEGKEKKQFVRIRLMAGNEILASRNHYFLPAKEIKWARAKVSFEIEKVETGYWIYVQSDKPVRALRLTHTASGHFSDNWFDLLPSEGKTVIFETEEEIQNFREGLELTFLNGLN